METKIQTKPDKIRCNICGKTYNIPAGYITTITQGDVCVQHEKIDWDHYL